MCIPAETSLLVSIQERGFENDPVAGHRAIGLLGDPHTVLIPHPPEELFDPRREFQAVMIPVPLHAEGIIERHNGWCLKAARIGSGGGAIAALLTLALPSRYRTMLTGFRADELGRVVEENGGDLWSALESLAIIPPEVREGPREELLRALPDIERLQRQYRIREHHLRAPGEVASWLCAVFCVCDSGKG